MKTLKIFVLLSAGMLLTAGCFQFPLYYVADETGDNQFYVEIDGQLYRALERHRIPVRIVWAGEVLEIRAVLDAPEKARCILEIRIEDFHGPGTYAIYDRPPGDTLVRFTSARLSIIHDGHYYSDGIPPAYIRILEADPESRHITGLFAFGARGGGGKRLELENGFFDWHHLYKP
ncbi:MAG: hypothetical protein GXO27_07470 [Chlorobi bacterium]|nr:hypothetical protein [Chlorobiota bacterium]